MFIERSCCSLDGPFAEVHDPLGTKDDHRGSASSSLMSEKPAQTAKKHLSGVVMCRLRTAVRADATAFEGDNDGRAWTDILIY